jgi:hypothetical protein
MEPEIARRCLNCGASVRGRAHFCPQCGRPMGEEAGRAREAAGPPRPAEHPLAEEAERVAASLGGRLPDAPATEPGSPSDSRARARVAWLHVARGRTPQTTPREAGATPGATSADAPDADKTRAGDGVAHRGVETRGGVRSRAAAVGASVGETLKPRVERLREASSVVIDEAAEDPGVRFLVIAAVLFLLFLLLWLLSFTLG